MLFGNYSDTQPVSHSCTCAASRYISSTIRITLRRRLQVCVHPKSCSRETTSCRILGIALMACITLGLSAYGGGAGCDTETVAAGPLGGASIGVGGAGGACGSNSATC